MWLKVIPYSCKDGQFKQKDLVSVIKYLTATSDTKMKQSSEWFNHNIKHDPLDVVAVEEWFRRIAANLVTPKRGRRLNRYAYQIIINLGTQKELKEEFKEVIKKFLKEDLLFGSGYVFIHTDTNNVHAHILLHPVQIDGRVVRFNRMVINHYRFQIDKYARPLYDIQERLERMKEAMLEASRNIFLEPTKPQEGVKRETRRKNEIKKLVQRLRRNRSMLLPGE